MKSVYCYAYHFQFYITLVHDGVHYASVYMDGFVLFYFCSFVVHVYCCGAFQYDEEVRVWMGMCGFRSASVGLYVGDGTVADGSFYRIPVNFFSFKSEVVRGCNEFHNFFFFEKIWIQSNKK